MKAIVILNVMKEKAKIVVIKSRKTNGHGMITRPILMQLVIYVLKEMGPKYRFKKRYITFFITQGNKCKNVFHIFFIKKSNVPSGTRTRLYF